ncbi:hypothetical protein ACC771_26150, partial [Rhizobium ruizarguesonis]
MAEETVADADTFMGAFDQARNVGQDEFALVDAELKKKTKELAKACGKTPFKISAVTGKGMTEVLRALRDIIVED